MRGRWGGVKAGERSCVLGRAEGIWYVERVFFFRAGDGIRDFYQSCGVEDLYKREGHGEWLSPVVCVGSWGGGHDEWLRPVVCVRTWGWGHD